MLASLPNLVRLDLSRTAVGDLSPLASSPQLELLNVPSTGANDAGLARLAGVKSLRRVYAWQTAVTASGVERLLGGAARRRRHGRPAGRRRRRRRPAIAAIPQLEETLMRLIPAAAAVLALLPLALAGKARASDAGLNCRDGSARPPRLQLVLNLWGLGAYPSAAEPWSEERKVAEAKAAGFDAFDVWGSGAKEADLARSQALAAQHALGVGVEFGPNRVEGVEEGIAVAKRLGSVYLDAHVSSYFLPERTPRPCCAGSWSARAPPGCRS